MKYNREYWDDDLDGDYDELLEYGSLTPSNYYTKEEMESEDVDDETPTITNIQHAIIAENLKDKGYTVSEYNGFFIDAQKDALTLRLAPSFLPDSWELYWKKGNGKQRNERFENYMKALEAIRSGKCFAK